MGLLLAEQGKLAEAIASYRKALALKPGLTEARQHLDQATEINESEEASHNRPPGGDRAGVYRDVTWRDPGRSNAGGPFHGVSVKPHAPLYAGLAFSFFFVAFGILLLISTIRGLHLAAQSTDWPATSGVVDESTVERHAGSRNSTATYSAKVLYSYEVNGKKLHGSTISFLYVTSGRQSDAASVCNAYPKNKPVTVYYSPHCAELSVLERGVKPLAWACQSSDS